MRDMVERPQWYAIRFPNPGAVAGLIQLGREIRVDTDAPFRMTGIAVYVFGAPRESPALGPAGNVGVTLRFTRPDGTWMQKHLISAQAINPFDAAALNGAGGFTAPYYSYFSPISPNVFYPAGSAVVLDYTALAGVTDALVLVVFLGTKIFDRAAVWAPTYPPKYGLRPFFGYDVQVDLSTLPVLNVPLNIQGDADFVWQAGAQTDNQAAALFPVGTARGIGIKLRDWAGKYYMNDFIPLEMIFGFDNSQTPGLLYPEIYIPKNEAIYMDLASVI